MNHERLQIGLLLAFIVFCMVGSQIAQAAIVIIPNMTGMSKVGTIATDRFGNLKVGGPPLPSYTTSTNNYHWPGIANIGGKAVSVAADVPLAANAGSLIKTGLKLAGGTLGPLAAVWLASEGIEWAVDHWNWRSSGMTCTTFSINTPAPYCSSAPATQAAQEACSATYFGPLQGYIPAITSGSWSGVADFGWTTTAATGTGCGTETRPATDDDWEALPSPVTTLAPELPTGPVYMPDGAPVDAPEYEPGDVSLGSPYTKPDGSTAEPRAKISPNTDGTITVDTYDRPLTDSNGDPVVDPLPQDTEERSESQTQCDKYPDTLGCAYLDEPEAEELGTEDRDIALLEPVTLGGVGICPPPMVASFLGQTVSMPFDPLCTYATTLKPLVLALAWLAAGIIFIGAVRGA